MIPSCKGLTIGDVPTAGGKGKSKGKGKEGKGNPLSTVLEALQQLNQRQQPAQQGWQQGWQPQAQWGTTSEWGTPQQQGGGAAASSWEGGKGDQGKGKGEEDYGQGATWQTYGKGQGGQGAYDKGGKGQQGWYGNHGEEGGKPGPQADAQWVEDGEGDDREAFTKWRQAKEQETKTVQAALQTTRSMYAAEEGRRGKPRVWLDPECVKMSRNGPKLVDQPEQGYGRISFDWAAVVGMPQQDRARLIAESAGDGPFRVVPTAIPREAAETVATYQVLVPLAADPNHREAMQEAMAQVDWRTATMRTIRGFSKKIREWAKQEGLRTGTPQEIWTAAGGASATYRTVPTQREERLREILRTAGWTEEEIEDKIDGEQDTDEDTDADSAFTHLGL